MLPQIRPPSPFRVSHFAFRVSPVSSPHAPPPARRRRPPPHHPHPPRFLHSTRFHPARRPLPLSRRHQQPAIPRLGPRPVRPRQGPAPSPPRLRTPPPEIPCHPQRQRTHPLGHPLRRPLL